MKHVLLSLLLLPYATDLHAQPPALAWARGAGGSQADLTEAVAADASGAVYTTGIFRGTVDFDPGAGTANLTATGTSGLFVTKFDSTGAFVWAKAVTATSSATPFDLTVDGSGNVIIGGGFTGTADFDPDPTATASYTSIVTQLFILKLSSSGIFSWVATMGGGLGRVFGVATDAVGDVYATGDFQNTIDFDPGAGTASLTAAGFNDIFVCKFSTAGTYQWAGRMGGGSADFGNSIAVDGSGVYAGGYFAGTADMDPSAATSNLTSSSNDGFIVKLTTAGAFVWAGAVGGSGSDAVGALATAPNGDIIASGTFQGTADFDPGAGSSTLTGAGSPNAFAVRLSSGGGFVWARALAASSTASYPGGVVVDAAGDAYFAGSFSGTADMDPGSGTSNLTAAGTTDGYLCKLTSAGGFVWAGSWGGSGGGNTGRDVVLDAAGQPIVGGEFVGSADFDLGAGSSTLTSAGSADGFVAKYRGGGGGQTSVAPRVHGPGSQLALFPNPATDFITLRSEARMAGAEARLLDGLGRSLRVWRGLEGYEHMLPLAGVPAGMYVLEFSGDRDATTTRLRVVKR